MLSQKMFLENKGFTLLEVLIAMSIMVIAMTAILSVQESSINAVSRSKQLNTVRLLAKNKMIEIEFDLNSQSFEEAEKEKTGRFDEPYQDYAFKRTVKEVQLPNLGSIAASTDDQGDRPASDLMQSTQKIVTDYLSKSIREVSVEIQWEKGGKPQSYILSQFLVNFGYDFTTAQ